MMAIIGLICSIVLPFGAYLMHGGDMGVIVEALPGELMTIGGVALGALLIGNTGTTLKGIGGGIKQVFSGSHCASSEHLGQMRAWTCGTT